MRVEQEQKVTEDARRFAEQDAAAQRYAAQVLQVFLSPSPYISASFSYCINYFNYFLFNFDRKSMKKLLLP